MVYVDKTIKKLIKEISLIEDYNENNITSIGYDLVIDSFIKEFDNNKPFIFLNNVTLKPLQSIFVLCKEKVNIPINLTAKVVLRNSYIRKGLIISCPQFYPNHSTDIIFNIFNSSEDDIKIKRNTSISTIIFEELNDIPSNIYNGRYQNEDIKKAIKK